MGTCRDSAKDSKVQLTPCLDRRMWVFESISKLIFSIFFSKVEKINSFLLGQRFPLVPVAHPLLRWCCFKGCGSSPQGASPAPSRGPAEEKRRHTALPVAKAPPNKPAGKEDAVFRPSVFSARRLNIRWVVFFFPDSALQRGSAYGVTAVELVAALAGRFSEAAQDNESRRPAVKTPGRPSSCVASSTPLKPAADAGKRKTAVFSATKTPGAFSLSRRGCEDGRVVLRRFSATDSRRALCFHRERQLREHPRHAEAQI